MADYFSEYSTYIGSKSLPSPADTPYETPGYLRSKRSSRVTPGSSREQSSSPPPLPPDTSDTPERSRDGRYGALDPRRFTPTLHASLVSEILNLRRELDSKNNLVENLETTLASAKSENETLAEQLSQHSKDVRRAKLEVQQIEKGTYDAVEDLVKERDLAITSADDLRSKLDAAQKTVRRQDEDAERTQRIWEGEKESWDNERRQLERRVHVTETRLRTVVDEMSAQQAAAEAQQVRIDEPEDSHFKDSGFGHESDNGSVRSASPAKHRRNKSSVSFKSKGLRNSTQSRATGTPEPYGRGAGYNLADELGIDEETEYDIDEFEHPVDELELEFSERLRKTMESRQSSTAGDADSKAKRILGLISGYQESPKTSPTMKEFPKYSADWSAPFQQYLQKIEQSADLPTVPEASKTVPVQYVDNGFQPSPPPSPQQAQPTMTMSIPRIEEPTLEGEDEGTAETEGRRSMLDTGVKSVAMPISPPESPVAAVSSEADVSAPTIAAAYSSAATQTEITESESRRKHQSRDSLSPPDYVPSIAIHPSSRPSSPRAYVLPPGTKNASTQTKLPWSSRDASVQTEEIRVDKRPVKLPAHLLPGYLLPSPTFQEPPRSRLSKRASAAGLANIVTSTMSVPSAPSSSKPQSPQSGSPEKLSRNNSQKDLRNMPLRAIPLPRPVLSPPLPQESMSEGPLNRSSQYGVTKSAYLTSPLLDIDKDSELSDYDGAAGDLDPSDLAGVIPGIIRPPQGRFGLSDPPKVVPEDKEISPERRPDTADSFGAAPAPSVSSSRANSTRGKVKPSKLTYKDIRSRSPSFASMASSSYSTQSVAPPFPIPTRSSSRIPPHSHSEGSQSPTPHYSDVFGNRGSRTSRSQSSRQTSLRKVQSAAVIRQSSRKTSPKKTRRLRTSPDLTPVHSMLVESPGPTNFPLPDVPTPMQADPTLDYIKGSVDLSQRPGTGVSSAPRQSEETNLVDAIAATMVGEWMWKYIRRKKSFGVQEDFPVAEDGTVTISAGTSRHKRWVWLSPYERTIMWDSKQPVSNSALLGKKGRKLAIQSVTEVQDNTPLPKNRELHSAYDRSILILTPARALKFTAVSAERHVLWMTALSFLAQSGRLPSQIPQMPSHPSRPSTTSRGPPPIPTQEAPQVKRNRSPSFGRLTVRDSIRLAKGKRPELPKSVSQPDAAGEQGFDTSGQHQRDDSADFPAVPRLYIGTSRHQRKRSNTSPRLPTSFNGLRSLSSTAVSSAGSSALQPPSTQSSFFRSNMAGNSSKSGSRNDSMASRDRPNFFEAVGSGTVRMDAFVDPNVRDGVLYVPAPPVAPEPTRQRGESNFSRPSVDKRRAGQIFDDPFRSFDFTAGNEISAR